MIVIAWGALVLGIITALVLGSTPIGYESAGLAGILAVCILLVCWGFGSGRTGARR